MNTLPKSIDIHEADVDSKIDEYLSVEGHNDVESAMMYSMFHHSTGICMQPLCSYTTTVEPDQEAGYCEACGGNTVVAFEILAMSVIA